jgi:hypothetical protein
VKGLENLRGGGVMDFKECVLACFDNVEFRSNWERLRQKSLSDHKNLRLFIKDVKNLVWDCIITNKSS